jgi:glycosyltransferase involved in cell wall biosynthesis
VESLAVSLIVSTRNRATQLGRCLDAITQLRSTVQWELIVVDNASSDDTAEVVRKFSDLRSVHVHYVHQPLPGLSNARNAGFQRSRGSVVAFTDDDCYVREDYLERIVEAFRDRDLGYVTGRILLHDPSDFPATINESLVPQEIPARSYIYAGMVKGANMAFRRQVLVEIGGFDPIFGSGAFFAADDCDAAARASLRGWRGRYDPDIVVSHHHGRKAADVGDLFRAYDIGRGAYHMKLLVQERAFGPCLRGWLGLVSRAWARPSSMFWEIAGAAHFLLVKSRGETSAK